MAIGVDRTELGPGAPGWRSKLVRFEEGDPELCHKLLEACMNECLAVALFLRLKPRPFQRSAQFFGQRHPGWFRGCRNGGDCRPVTAECNLNQKAGGEEPFFETPRQIHAQTVGKKIDRAFLGRKGATGLRPSDGISSCQRLGEYGKLFEPREIDRPDSSGHRFGGGSGPCCVQSTQDTAVGFPAKRRVVLSQRFPSRRISGRLYDLRQLSQVADGHAPAAILQGLPRPRWSARRAQRPEPGFSRWHPFARPTTV